MEGYKEEFDTLVRITHARYDRAPSMLKCDRDAQDAILWAAERINILETRDRMFSISEAAKIARIEELERTGRIDIDKKCSLYHTQFVEDLRTELDRLKDINERQRQIIQGGRYIGTDSKEYEPVFLGVGLISILSAWRISAPRCAGRGRRKNARNSGLRDVLRQGLLPQEVDDRGVHP